MGPEALPELKQIVGALLFGAGKPLTLKEVRTCLVETGERYGAETKVFEEVSESDLAAVMQELTSDLDRQKFGFHLQSHGGAFRFQSDPSCGKWLKQLLAIGQANRLSRPALETLSIIAYRQPITKAEIEKVRGVNVDHMIKMLMELQLVRISGRSDLPGRPFLFGTTQNFLEHFGLKDLKDLSDLEPMLKAGSSEEGQSSDRPEPTPVAAPWVAKDPDHVAVPSVDADASGGGASGAEAVPSSDSDSDKGTQPASHTPSQEEENDKEQPLTDDEEEDAEDDEDEDDDDEDDDDEDDDDDDEDEDEDDDDEDEDEDEDEEDEEEDEEEDAGKQK